MTAEEFRRLHPLAPCPTCGEATLRVLDGDGKEVSCMLCIGERMFNFTYTRTELEQRVRQE